MTGQQGAARDPIVIRKYANRRLYNTADSRYVTLGHLCRMVKDGQYFTVYDARSGDDITRSVLTQIIVEEEGKGHNLLPIAFLRQLIQFYGDSLQWMVPRYLEHAMSSLAHNRDRLRQSMQEAFGAIFNLEQFEELGKQNAAMFERALKMFSSAGIAEAQQSEQSKQTAPTEQTAQTEQTAPALRSEGDADSAADSAAPAEASSPTPPSGRDASAPSPTAASTVSAADVAPTPVSSDPAAYGEDPVIAMLKSQIDALQRKVAELQDRVSSRAGTTDNRLES